MLLACADACMCAHTHIVESAIYAGEGGRKEMDTCISSCLPFVIADCLLLVSSAGRLASTSCPVAAKRWLLSGWPRRIVCLLYLGLGGSSPLAPLSYLFPLGAFQQRLRMSFTTRARSWSTFKNTLTMYGAMEATPPPLVGDGLISRTRPRLRLTCREFTRLLSCVVEDSK